MFQRRHFKVLNETIRRLRKKMSSLEALFKHLKSNNLITEEAHDEILVYILYLKTFYNNCCLTIFTMCYNI